MENILKKGEEGKEDPYLALLYPSATSMGHDLMSLAELLTGRKFKTRLAMCQRPLCATETLKLQQPSL